MLLHTLIKIFNKKKKNYHVITIYQDFVCIKTQFRGLLMTNVSER